MNVTFSEEPMKSDKFGHRTADWSDQVQKGVQELHSYFILVLLMVWQEAGVFDYTPGRTMPGASDYQRKDTVDFKVNLLEICIFTNISYQELRRHIKRYNKELAYYIKVCPFDLWFLFRFWCLFSLQDTFWSIVWANFLPLSSRLLVDCTCIIFRINIVACQLVPECFFTDLHYFDKFWMKDSSGRNKASERETYWVRNFSRFSNMFRDSLLAIKLGSLLWGLALSCPRLGGPHAGVDFHTHGLSEVQWIAKPMVDERRVLNKMTGGVVSLEDEKLEFGSWKTKIAARKWTADCPYSWIRFREELENNKYSELSSAFCRP